MTIQDALDRLDVQKPNKIDVQTKRQWLSELDGMIWIEVLLEHEPDARLERLVEGEAFVIDESMPPESWFVGYGPEADMNTELLVVNPFSEDVYMYWLAAQVDLVNMETNGYANDHELYNAAFSRYQNYYRKSHMPKQRVSCLHL